ncbi:hypothetical protein RINTHH_11650 [Richelia intracellularis HH01]|uniref:Uncharacterized protein n=1 Tax=Richelia intracellularis HH01 TaxID=1165094 RepID=M1X2S2_9NOST|nr:hypothetical protein RINTHH_11650 [Richelia intracellularis HH01]
MMIIGELAQFNFHHKYIQIVGYKQLENIGVSTIFHIY